MDLGGLWNARVADDDLRRSFPDPDLDDETWDRVAVPGHWRQTSPFVTADGPLLYRRRFEASPPDPAPGQRSWLTLDGIFYQGDVWLDGSYLGDTEGYFAPQSFEITEPLATRSEHLLAIEVACAPQRDRRAKRNLTGVYQHWDCIDEDWNPGGIWAPVRITHTGPVRIASLRVTCPEASSERAQLELVATLDAGDSCSAHVETSVCPERGGECVVESSTEHRLAQGANRVRWRITVERPDLWWPRALGAQPLHRIDINVVVDGQISDHRPVTTGLRQVGMRNFVATVNGERMFLKGANLGPTRRAPADATPQELARDVHLGVEAGLDLLRVHAHVARAEVYDAADRAGMLLWQDLPLQWAYKGVRKQAVRQARAAVDLLAHHPSVAIWCGHNEPFALKASAADPTSRSDRWRRISGQALPSWNRTRLDRSLKRALSKSDSSRPVVANSGVLPHPVGGTDTHLYYGWYRGAERDLAPALARLPVLARWVGEFGAQAVPESDEFLGRDDWPDLDWDRLEHAHGLQKAIFDRRVPPADYPDLEAWRRATQRYQADVIRFHVETLRRLKYRPAGGFCQFLLADAQPAVSWSVLDHRRVAKTGYAALAEACVPVIAVADRPAPNYIPGERLRLALHVVSDLRVPLPGVALDAELRWPGGRRTWRFEGDIDADTCARIGRLEVIIPPDCQPGQVHLELLLRCPDPGPALRRVTYDSEVVVL